MKTSIELHRIAVDIFEQKTAGDLEKALSDSGLIPSEMDHCRKCFAKWSEDGIELPSKLTDVLPVEVEVPTNSEVE